MLEAWVIVKTASEISLKSGFVRQEFMKRLERNIKSVLKAQKIEAGGFYKRGGRIFFQTGRPEKAVAALGKVFGVHALAVAERHSPAELPAIEQEAGKYSVKVLKKGKSFAVRAKLAAIKHFNSHAVEVRAGDSILKAVKGVRVNLSKPDVKIVFEVFEDCFYVYAGQVKGFGGLPVGVSGKVGFIAGKKLKDDFKACWLLLKRGCEIVLIGKPGKLAKKLKDWNSMREVEVVESAEVALMQGVVCFAKGDAKLSEKSIKNFESFDAKQKALMLRPLLLAPEKVFEGVKA